MPVTYILHARGTEIKVQDVNFRDAPPSCNVPGRTTQHVAAHAGLLSQFGTHRLRERRQQHVPRLVGLRVREGAVGRPEDQ